jgi:DnaK suppressor protein
MCNVLCCQVYFASQLHLLFSTWNATRFRCLLNRKRDAFPGDTARNLSLTFMPVKQGQEPEAAMNKEECELFRLKLLRMRSDLQEQEDISGASGDAVELDQSRVGRLSRMDAMQAQQMALEVARRRQHQLLKIEGAMRRIESGEYGYCFVCGEEIDIRRLSIDPTSSRCMVCAEK